MSLREILGNARRQEALRKSLLITAPYYPEYETLQNPEHGKTVLYITTIVRQFDKDREEYRAQHFVESSIVDREKDTLKEIELQLLGLLTKKVYISRELYKPNDIKRPNGELLNPRDEIQKSEEERIREKYL